MDFKWIKTAQLWKLGLELNKIYFPREVSPFLIIILLLFSFPLLPHTGTGQVFPGRAAVWAQPDGERCSGTWRFVPGCRAGRDEAGAAEVCELEPGHGTSGTQSGLQEFLLEDFHILLALSITVHTRPLTPPPNPVSLPSSLTPQRDPCIRIEDCKYEIKLWWNYGKQEFGGLLSKRFFSIMHGESELS